MSDIGMFVCAQKSYDFDMYAKKIEKSVSFFNFSYLLSIRK